MAVTAATAEVAATDPALDLPRRGASCAAIPMTVLPIDQAQLAHRARAEAQYAQLKAVLRVVLAAVLLALGLRSFAYEPFNISSDSMLPTLMAGDYLFVAKSPYGWGRFTLPLGLPLFDGRIFDTAPARGDVVVFKSPRDNRTDFIKRVVGLPGDRVRISGGRIELNGRLLPKTRLPDLIVAMPAGGDCDSGPGRPDFRVHNTDGRAMCRFPRFAERIAGRDYAVLDQIDGDLRDNTAIVVVPAGRYFVLGDNRDDSADSRLSVADGGVGLVPANNLIGRATRVFFSVDGSARLADPASWLASIRGDRIGAAL